MPDEQATTPASVPKQQFRLDGLVVNKELFEEIARAPREEGEQRPARIHTGLQVNTLVQSIPEPMRAIVTLDVQVTPDPKWQPYRLQVKLAGAFAGENVSPEQFDQFCRISVPPILFPYVREIVHRLTIDAQHGPVRLDPINVAEMVSQAEWVTVPTEQATVSNEP